MKQPVLDVIVVGAGHAGLSASYFLKKHGLQHIVFERGKIGESWRSQRWDSFRLNSPNHLNVLAGEELTLQPGDFALASSFVNTLNDYATKYQLPVLEKVKVLSVEKDDSEIFTVTVETIGQLQKYYSRQVIIASGTQNEKKLPAFSSQISNDILQLHASEYRNAAQLKGGAVLVVGSAQSGCQIAEDIVDAGRKVFFSTSMVARLPRTYRGRDIMDWLMAMKFFDARIQDIADPASLKMKAPQLTGVGNKTISLQSLAKKGAAIIGKVDSATGKTVTLQPNAAQHVQFADHFSMMVKGMINEFIEKTQIDAPPPSIDLADEPDTSATCVTDFTTLDLEENHINNIIWSTGFNADFSYIKLPVLDAEGFPIYDNGSSSVAGLYFLGLAWLRARKSALIYGAKDDAEYIAGLVQQLSIKQETLV